VDGDLGMGSYSSRFDDGNDLHEFSFFFFPFSLFFFVLDLRIAIINIFVTLASSQYYNRSTQ